MVSLHLVQIKCIQCHQCAGWSHSLLYLIFLKCCLGAERLPYWDELHFLEHEMLKPDVPNIGARFEIVP